MVLIAGDQARFPILGTCVPLMSTCCSSPVKALWRSVSQRLTTTACFGSFSPLCLATIHTLTLHRSSGASFRAEAANRGGDNVFFRAQTIPRCVNASGVEAAELSKLLQDDPAVDREPHPLPPTTRQHNPET